MKTSKMDLLIWVMAIFYFIFSIFSIFKWKPRKTFNKKHDDREEWVEVPMMTGNYIQLNSKKK